MKISTPQIFETHLLKISRFNESLPMRHGWVDSQIELLFEFVLFIKNDQGRAIPISCGWCREKLSELIKASRSDFQLKIAGGIPIDPVEIKPADVKTGRKGVFASLGKMLTAQVKSS
jgi:hypothetical protein